MVSPGPPLLVLARAGRSGRPRVDAPVDAARSLFPLLFGGGRQGSPVTVATQRE